LVLDAWFILLVHRSDRKPNKNNQSYGGVLIAINKEFISTEVSELKTDCEIVWSQINMSGSKNLLIGAYYRRPSDKETSLQQPELSLSRINHASNTNIILNSLTSVLINSLLIAISTPP
jgi:hypothetical protein